MDYHFESEDLADLAHLDSGIFTFTVVYADSNSDSTSVYYGLPNGDPIPPVTQEPQLLYPPNEATAVPLAISFQFVQGTDPNWTSRLEWKPYFNTPKALEGQVSLPNAASSYGPVYLSPGLYYEVELTLDHAVWMSNDDGIPTVMDKDVERDLTFTTTSSGSHVFRETGDLNADGHVTLIDLAILSRHWLEYQTGELDSVRISVEGLIVTPVLQLSNKRG